MLKLLKLLAQLFASKTWIMLAGVILTVLSFGSSLGLLTLSAWFLASCYLIASIDFNIFYPSSSIRGFAVARTVFKYIQRLVTHKATFDILTKLRVQVFAAVLPVSTDLHKLAKLKTLAENATAGQSNTSPKKSVKPKQPSKTDKPIITETNSNIQPATVKPSSGSTTGQTTKVLISDNELFDRVIKDIDQLNGFYVNILLPFIGTIITILGFTIGLSYIEPTLAWFVGISLLLTTIVIPWIFYPLGKKISTKVEYSTTKLRLAFLNYLELHFENLVFNNRAKHLKTIEDLNTQLVEQQLRKDNLIHIATLILQIILGLLVTVTFGFASYLGVLTDPDLRFPGLALTFGFLVIGSVELIVPLAGLFLQLGQILNAAENLEEMLNDKAANKISNFLIDEVKQKEKNAQEAVAERERLREEDLKRQAQANSTLYKAVTKLKESLIHDHEKPQDATTLLANLCIELAAQQHTEASIETILALPLEKISLELFSETELAHLSYQEHTKLTNALGTLRQELQHRNNELTELGYHPTTGFKPNGFEDAPDTTSLYPNLLDPQLLQKISGVNVVVDNLNFSFNETKIIRSLSYTFKAGESYLISGDSGKGKTTFLNCVLGLETSFTGDISFLATNVQGQLLTTLNASKGQQRQLCTHLSQRVHIFNDTLRENLLLANPQASDAQLQAVLEQVELSYIPLHTVLGNGGRSLSGGEIRRIGISRILLSKAKVFLLDEPTESIDYETEQKILKLIFAHAHNIQATIILISHNQVNYQYCQHILQLVNNHQGKTELVPLRN